MRRYQTTPSGRDATTTTLLPRVSLVRDGERGETPDALQEGLVVPTGATTSTSDKPTRISPDPITLGAPEHSTTQSATQRHMNAKSLTKFHHGQEQRRLHTEEEEPGLGAAAPSTCGRDQPPPSQTVTDLVGPLHLERPVKLPSTRCRRHTVDAAAPHPSCSPTSVYRRPRHCRFSPTRLKPRWDPRTQI